MSCIYGRVSTEVTFGRGDLSVCPLGGFTGAHAQLISNWRGVPQGYPQGQTLRALLPRGTSVLYWDGVGSDRLRRGGRAAAICSGERVSESRLLRVELPGGAACTLGGFLAPWKWDPDRVRPRKMQDLSTRSGLTPSPPTKTLDFGGFDSSKLLFLRGGNSHVEIYRESPGKFDSRTLSRETLSRWTGRIQTLLTAKIIRIKDHTYNVLYRAIMYYTILWYTMITSYSMITLHNTLQHNILYCKTGIRARRKSSPGESLWKRRPVSP